MAVAFRQFLYSALASFDVILCVLLLAAFIFWSSLRRPKNFPPGPRGWPIVGSLFNIDQTSHRYFKWLSDKYGSNVISIKLGMHNVVVLNDWKSMHEALIKKSELFAGRPKVFIFKATMKNSDVVTTEGPLWKERKRFTVQHLREIIVDKQLMEELIMEEVNKTIDYMELEQSKSNKVEISHLFFTPILSIISRITTGSTFSVDDEAMRNLSKVMKFNFDCYKYDSPLNFMAYLRHVPGMTNYHEFMDSHKKVEDVLQSQIDMHHDTYVKGQDPRDFVDSYLEKIMKGSDKKRSEYPFQKENLLGVMYNLYNAGVETTDHTLSFGLMYMAIWPEIQSNVQEELDRVIGSGRLPVWKDRSLLPYTEATISEMLRHTSVLPLSIPHSPMADAELFGYTIPKDTFILPNIWAVHFDKELWGDPETFRPERFLDVNGNVQKPEYLIPFSLGSRFCLGESLARMELFLFFTCLMQTYSFHCITGQRPPDIEPIVGVTQRPRPFSLVIKPRRVLV